MQDHRNVIKRQFTRARSIWNIVFNSLQRKFTNFHFTRIKVTFIYFRSHTVQFSRKEIAPHQFFVIILKDSEFPYVNALRTPSQAVVINNLL